MLVLIITLERFFFFFEIVQSEFGITGFVFVMNVTLTSGHRVSHDSVPKAQLKPKKKRQYSQNSHAIDMFDNVRYRVLYVCI